MQVANPDIPLCDLALLNWVSHRVPSFPAYDENVNMFYICSDGTHTQIYMNIIENMYI